MEKNYREIEFSFGSIDDAVKKLSQFKETGELVYIIFNDQKLYSDIDDLDSAYKKITGKTKSEFDKDQEERHAEYEKEKKQHEEAIPKLTEEWVEKGKKVLDEKYWELWIKCVPIRLGDLYRGMELGACLEIVEELNKGCSLNESKAIIDGQGHSGMSRGLVCSMVKSFCRRGEEFVAFVR